MGNGEVVDGMIKHGLSDVYSDKRSSISREQQDDYSIQSYERVIATTNAGVVQWEMVAVEVPGARGKPSLAGNMLWRRGSQSSPNYGSVWMLNKHRSFSPPPALAIPKAVKRAGIDASQVDFYEINEAFSVVALANQKLLGLDSAKVNVHGGAVSLGHPLGCSGARIVVTLLGVLKAKQGTYGVAGVCNGGGGASALVVELTPTFAASHL
ncbi:hypothetical protein R1sor_013535 [Riccia sorocarpa]|uniref:Thiolase C-terminal domain-containing protein n=1 Tax=Riccia sorocarpa TaxID=122646 RepID=A0ABD3H8S6_9MARC